RLDELIRSDEPHPSRFPPDSDLTIGPDCPAPPTGRHEDYPRQGGPPRAAPGVSPDVAVDIARIPELPTNSDHTPTEPENTGRSPAPTEVAFSTSPDPEATIVGKVQRIADSGVAFYSDAETLKDPEVAGDLVPLRSTVSALADGVVASSIPVSSENGDIDP